MTHSDPAPYRVRVWDLPTRLFHWLLALAVVLLVVTGQVGGQAMVWHFRLGLFVGSLLMFRLIWGVVGGHHSRFWSFVRGPRAVLGYLQGQVLPEHEVGHNPLGAFSVLAMLLVLCLQVGSGTMSDDEIAFAGPLAQYVRASSVSLATWYHKEVGKLLILALVALHIAAIVYHRLQHGQNLVRPMIVGDKVLAHDAKPSKDDWAHRLMAAAVYLPCGCFFYWISGL